MNLEIRQSSDCGKCLEIFTINGIKADEDDFGQWSKNHCEGYGCKDCFFERYTNRPLQVIKNLNKYGINEEEYDEVCDELEKNLQVYSCHLCE